MSVNQPLVINGWNIFTHSLFLAQIEELLAQVADLQAKDPEGYKQKNATKRLMAIAKLAFEIIPQAPSRKEYRLGTSLGEAYKHWFRAKFFQQYRLFFRYHQASRIIIFVWVNDENSKRAYGSDTDAYRVFQKMLDSGCPPDNLSDLFLLLRIKRRIQKQKIQKKG